MDDAAFGADNDDFAYELYLSSKNILKTGGFNLRKFLSNSKELQRRIEDTESQYQCQASHSSKQDSACTQALEIIKVLGGKWDLVNDSLLTDLGDIADEAPNKTKCDQNSKQAIRPTGICCTSENFSSYTRLLRITAYVLRASLGDQHTQEFPRH